MSYFYCVCGCRDACVEPFDDLLVDIAPPGERNVMHTVESGISGARIYGSKKVIPDRLVIDEQGSWLALIGTPLLSLACRNDALSLLAKFLTHPGETILSSIDGNFGLLAYDAQAQRLIAATDFNTTIPMFYSNIRGCIAVSSHELALAKLQGAEIDPAGFSQAIHMGTTWGSQTRFLSIQKMMPCQLMVFEANGSARAETYWEPQHEKIVPARFTARIEEWNALLSKAVVKYYECAGCNPVIADFTAGEDARLLLAHCHAAQIPFTAQVTGLDDDVDVIIARKAAATAGFDLLVRPRQTATKDQILAHAMTISVENDGYQDFYKAFADYATNMASTLDDHGIVKYCGLPGGEAFRGSYYLRGKALFPSSASRLDSKFFVNMKYLLDFHPGLLRYPDHRFLDDVETLVSEALTAVDDFPIGIQIDHLLRVFQTCGLGLKYKNPLYLPFATNELTRSIYWLDPRHKQGGKLTKACTEDLFPELAFVKTQNGVPTIRKTVSRFPLFLPEYVATARKIWNGALSRLLKWRQSNKWYYSQDWSQVTLMTLLNESPYREWFASSETMATGDLYHPDLLEGLITEAREGATRYVPIVGRVVNMELAIRWVYGTAPDRSCRTTTGVH